MQYKKPERRDLTEKVLLEDCVNGSNALGQCLAGTGASGFLLCVMGDFAADGCTFGSAPDN